MHNNKKYIQLLITLVVIAGLAIGYLKMPNSISEPTFSSEVASLKVDKTSDEFVPINDLTKAIAFVESTLALLDDSNSYMQLSLKDYRNQIAVYSTGSSGTYFTFSDRLYLYDREEKKAAEIFSGLIHNCCDTTMPNITDAGGLYISVSTGTGDECYWEGQQVLVGPQHSDASASIAKVVTYGNDCSNIDYIKVSIEGDEYSLKPMFSDTCRVYDGTQTIHLRGFQMASINKTYDYLFTEPIRTACVHNQEFGDGIDKYISYDIVSLFPDTSFTVRIGGYEKNEYKVYDTKYMEFDFRSGLTERQ